MTLLAAAWTVVVGAKDFSLAIAFFSVLIGLLMMIMVIGSLNFKTYNRDFFERLIVNIFVIQSLFSLCAFVSPTVREIVHHFQFAEDAAKAEASYAGFRGLAISGRLYFEFAATCGLVTIIQFKRISDNKNSSWKEYIKLILIVICGFFAGRTSMIGFGFGIVYLILCKAQTKNKLRIIGNFILILLICVASCALILPPDILIFVTDFVAPWVFDLFIKFSETGSTSDSASFNHLNEMYEYVTITSEEWIYGSGRFMSSTGGYYKSVDGGYIRHLLYWGVIGSFFNILYGLLYFIKPYFKSIFRDDRIFIILICLYSFFLHYKGDLVTTSRFYHVPLVIVMLPYVIKPGIFFKYGTNRYRNSVG